MKFEIITRQQAATLGRKRFYTGRPCAHGHDAQRFVSTGGCVACNSARSQLFSKAVSANGKVFVYALHPGDVAAALAYCQALDMQRGRTPALAEGLGGVRNPRGTEPVAIPEHVQAKWDQLARHNADRLTQGGPARYPGEPV